MSLKAHKYDLMFLAIVVVGFAVASYIAYRRFR